MKFSQLFIQALKDIGLTFLIVLPLMGVFVVVPALIMNTDTSAGNYISDHMEGFFTIMTFAMIFAGTAAFLYIGNRKTSKAKK